MTAPTAASGEPEPTGPSPKTERRILWLLALVAVASIALVGAMQPGLIRFWPFTIGEFVQLITPLFLVALFIERVLEVFLTSWRAEKSTELGIQAEKAASGLPPEKARAQDAALAAYRARTQRIAFLVGTVIGVVVAALGIRVLELFVDPAVFRALPRTQQTLFQMADVLFTGAVLGGGSDGLHKLVNVFTNFMDSTADLAKRRAEHSR